MIAWTVIAAALAGQPSDHDVYTLYRSSATGVEMRIHVATFDADEGEAYNHENCQIAARLFEQQPGTTVRYWCELGRYRK